MHVKGLQLDAFKGFTRARLEFRRDDGTLPGWHVLAGRNGSGKSSVLEAIAAALYGDKLMYRLRDNFEGWVHKHARDLEARVRLEITRDPKLDRWSEKTADTEPGRHRRDLEALDWTVVFTGLGSSHTQMSLRRRRDSPHEAVEYGPWRRLDGHGWMIAGYGPRRRLSGHSQSAQAIMGERSGVGAVVTLFRDDASLAEAGVWLRELELQGRQAPIPLRSILDLCNDGLLPDGMVAKQVDDEGVLWLEQGGLTLPLAEVGEGYRAVISLLLDLLYRLSVAYGPERLDSLDALPGIVLIDEAETHLHPQWQQRLGFWLVDHFPRLQFIVTTHSPFICQAAAHGSLTRLSAKGPDQARRLDGDAFWSVVNGSADQAVQTELFGVEQLHSDRAEAALDELARLEVKLLRGGTLSPRERQRFDELRVQQPATARAEVERFDRLLEQLE